MSDQNNKRMDLTDGYLDNLDYKIDSPEFKSSNLKTNSLHMKPPTMEIKERGVSDTIILNPGLMSGDSVIKSYPGSMGFKDSTNPSKLLRNGESQHDQNNFIHSECISKSNSGKQDNSNLKSHSYTDKSDIFIAKLSHLSGYQRLNTLKASTQYRDSSNDLDSLPHV